MVCRGLWSYGFCHFLRDIGAASRPLANAFIAAGDVTVGPGWILRASLARLDDSDGMASECHAPAPRINALRNSPAATLPWPLWRPARMAERL